MSQHYGENLNLNVKYNFVNISDAICLRPKVIMHRPNGTKTCIVSLYRFTIQCNHFHTCDFFFS